MILLACFWCWQVLVSLTPLLPPKELVNLQFQPLSAILNFVDFSVVSVSSDSMFRSDFELD